MSGVILAALCVRRVGDNLPETVWSLRGMVERSKGEQKSYSILHIIGIERISREYLYGVWRAFVKILFW